MAANSANSALHCTELCVVASVARKSKEFPFTATLNTYLSIAAMWQLLELHTYINMYVPLLLLLLLEQKITFIIIFSCSWLTACLLWICFVPSWLTERWDEWWTGKEATERADVQAVGLSVDCSQVTIRHKLRQNICLHSNRQWRPSNGVMVRTSRWRQLFQLLS